MPRIVALSDTHCKHSMIQVPEGDILVHAGDATSRGTLAEMKAFLTWFETQPHQHKIFVAGNHDMLAADDHSLFEMLLEEHPTITYLEDSGTEIMGLRFYGTPWVSWCGDWAFVANSAERYEIWKQIPTETDVLVTHSPIYQILDLCKNGDKVGCQYLRDEVINRIKPKLLLHGHIHEAYGQHQLEHTLVANCAQLNEVYQPMYKPHILDL